MIVMVVGGPNKRTDYHDDPVEEFFYQLKGDMLLKVHDGKEFYDVPIREGEMFLLPPHVRHSPQRPQEGSIGLVIEPKPGRRAQLDAIEWYCFECERAGAPRGAASWNRSSRTCRRSTRPSMPTRRRAPAPVAGHAPSRARNRRRDG
jgi:hypothetical protein